MSTPQMGMVGTDLAASIPKTPGTPLRRSKHTGKLLLREVAISASWVGTMARAARWPVSELKAAHSGTLITAEVPFLRWQLSVFQQRLVTSPSRWPKCEASHPVVIPRSSPPGPAPSTIGLPRQTAKGN